MTIGAEWITKAGAYLWQNVLMAKKTRAKGYLDDGRIEHCLGYSKSISADIDDFSVW